MEESIVVDDLNVPISKVFYIAHAIFYINRSLVDEGEQYLEFTVDTTEPLVANRLIDIKIEYKENTGEALIHLFWQSTSQPLTVIGNT